VTNSPEPPSRGPARGLPGTLFARGSLYILAVILRQAAALVLLTILVATISGEDFTRFGLMLSGFALLVPLATFNIHVAPTRLYFNSDDTQVRANLLKSSLAGAVCLGSVGGPALESPYRKALFEMSWSLADRGPAHTDYL